MINTNWMMDQLISYSIHIEKKKDYDLIIKDIS